VNGPLQKKERKVEPKTKKQKRGDEKIGNKRIVSKEEE